MKKIVVALVVLMAVVQAFACAAITKKGTQCRRAPSPGSIYCWQHGGTTAAQRAAGLTEADVAKMRCKAITKAGTQCKRTAQVGSDFCWQHAGIQGVKTAAPKVGEPKNESASDRSSAAETSAERTQCDAITKSGKRCGRKALPGGTKCWQHAK